MGEYEYGSPVLPKTLEAHILHCADDMDAKSKVFEEFISADSTAGLGRVSEDAGKEYQKVGVLMLRNKLIYISVLI